MPEPVSAPDSAPAPESAPVPRKPVSVARAPKAPPGSAATPAAASPFAPAPAKPVISPVVHCEFIPLETYLSVAKVSGYDGSPDGKSVVFISDKSGTPQLYLQPLTAAENAPVPPAKPLAKLPGPVQSARFLPDGSAIRAAVYEGSDERFSIYRVDPAGKIPPERVEKLDAQSAESKPAPWPAPAYPGPGRGRFDSPRYTPDGQWYLLTGVGDQLGDDLWISHRPPPGSHETTPVQVTRNLPASLTSACLNEGVIVGIPAPGDKPVPALMYRREAAAKAALIFLGPGYLAERRPEYDPLFQYFANRGFIVLVLTLPAAEGEGSDRARARAFAAFAENAVVPAREWLEKEQQIPEGRTALWGNGEGGAFALMAMAAAPGKFAGAVTVGAPTDLGRWLASLPEGSEKDWLKKSLGDPRKKSDELLKHSPLYVKNGADLTPLVILHGRNDRRVPVEHAERLAERLLGETRGFTFHVFDGEGAVFRKRETKVAAYNLVLKFMRRHFLDKPLPVVKKPGSAPIAAAPVQPVKKPGSTPGAPAPVQPLKKKPAAPADSVPKTPIPDPQPPLPKTASVPESPPPA